MNKSSELARSAAKRRVFELATAMLRGELVLIEGVRQIVSCAQDTGDEELPCFLTLMGIASETDVFPIGIERHHWNKDALAEKDIKLAAATEWWNDEILRLCEEIRQLYSSL